MPNWNITYTGLTNIPGIADVFRNLILKDNYVGSLSMAGYGTNLTYLTIPRDSVGRVSSIPFRAALSLISMCPILPSRSSSPP